MITSSQIKSVIFDMDDVLIDFMPYHVKAWDLAFKKYDLIIDSEIIYKLEGSDYKQTIEFIFNKMNKTPSINEINTLRREQDKIFNRIVNIEPFEGVDVLLKKLKQICSLAVVSGYNTKNVERVINDNFKDDIFDVVITGNDTEAIVVENAPLGIKSAKNANLFCIGLQTYLNRDFLKEADIIIENHIKLTKYLLHAFNL
ncbi:MAG: HAD family phosphatase [Methanobrevibacter sp.]|jgi:beta-phosphoglucomutase-like phosphatase (HAD superfamily)|nr:HAD family phosphatase [Candidatus Methanovirga aequatorialis]